MAETENSIEYQSTIVVKVDVHHYDSSRIKDSAQNKNIKRPKTVAERMREYRARKKMRIQKIQSVNDVSPIIHYQDDNIMVEANDDIEIVPVFEETLNQDTNSKRPKTAAERMREYRARNRKKKLASDVSSIIHHQDDNIMVEANDDIEIVPVFAETGNQDTNSKRPKTAAERMREYRARNRNKIHPASDVSSTIHHRDDNIKVETDYDNENVLEFGETFNQNINTNRLKTGVEHIRQYRGRNRNKNQSAPDVSSVIHQQDVSIKVETDDSNENMSGFAETFI